MLSHQNFENSTSKVTKRFDLLRLILTQSNVTQLYKICTHSKIVNLDKCINKSAHKPDQMLCSFEVLGFFHERKTYCPKWESNATQTLEFLMKLFGLYLFQLRISFISRHRIYRQSEYWTAVICSKVLHPAFQSSAATSDSRQNYESHFQFPSSIVLAMAKPNFSFGVNFEAERVAGNEIKQQNTVLILDISVRR